MKRIIILLVLLSVLNKIQSQGKYFKTSEQIKTYGQRVNSQGTTPPQPRLNFYTDKAIALFDMNLWKGDQVLSIKEIKVMPVNDPSDWYYFVAVKTKLCTTPFYYTYDIGDSQYGEFFKYEEDFLPLEFRKHCDAIIAKRDAAEAKIEADKKAAEAKVKAENDLWVSKKTKVEDNEIDSIMKVQGLTRIKDYDGNTYRVLQFAKDIWMIDNLKTTHFNNGDEIKTNKAEISNDTTSVYQWAYNNNIENANTYGRLYTWYAVTDKRNACPEGYHLPSLSEWNDLEATAYNIIHNSTEIKKDYPDALTYARGSVEGWALKQYVKLLWKTPIYAFNITYFSALPAGYWSDKTSISLGQIAVFWLADEKSKLNSIYVQLNPESMDVKKLDIDKNIGFSVRCIKDKTGYITTRDSILKARESLTMINGGKDPDILNGTIKNEVGQPMSDAIVIVQELNTIYTNANGEFSIEIPEEMDNLNLIIMNKAHDKELKYSVKRPFKPILLVFR